LTIAAEQPNAPLALQAPTVSVVICAYSLERQGVLREAIESIGRQTRPALEAILVVDNNPELLAWAREEFPQVRACANSGRGSSEAKNTATALAQGEVLAFLDDDAVAAEDWLAKLIGPYADPDVVGTTGNPIPRWKGPRPAWLPVEFYWTIGCGYRGLPTVTTPVRNPIGASMSFRKGVFEQIGGFSAGLGPNMSTPRAHGGGEETELGIRAARAFPHVKLLHVPEARVDHEVPLSRTSFAYYRRRCWLEGKAKAQLSEMVGVGDGLSSERSYTLKTLPTGVLRGFLDFLGGDPAGLQRAGAIMFGLAVTTAGYIAGRIGARLPGRVAWQRFGRPLR
jgi:glycosyltransferase involved in cell wall biosynthesis